MNYQKFLVEKPNDYIILKSIVESYSLSREAKGEVTTHTLSGRGIARLNPHCRTLELIGASQTIKNRIKTEAWLRKWKDE